MNREELKTFLHLADDAMKAAVDQGKAARQVYLDEHARFKVGDHVLSLGWKTKHSGYLVPEFRGRVTKVFVSGDNDIRYGITPDRGNAHYYHYETIYRDDPDLSLINGVTIE